MPDKTKSNKANTSKQVATAKTASLKSTTPSKKVQPRSQNSEPKTASVKIKKSAVAISTTKQIVSAKVKPSDSKAKLTASAKSQKSAVSRTTTKQIVSPKVKPSDSKAKQTASAKSQKSSGAGRSFVKNIGDKPLTMSGIKKMQLEEILAELGRRDRKLKALIPKVEGGFSLKIKYSESPFAAITEAIVYQQLTGKAAATIFGRLKALFGSDDCPTPEQIISAPDTVLRSSGLSRSKIVALKDLADKTINGLIPTLDEVVTMTDDEIIASLSAVKGVGVWTAHMFLIFRLGRLDVMPSGDYGVKKGYSLTYGDGESLPAPRELEQFAEIWRPYRTVGSWYMWRAIELQRKSR